MHSILLAQIQGFVLAQDVAQPQLDPALSDLFSSGANLIAAAKSGKYALFFALVVMVLSKLVVKFGGKIPTPAPTSKLFGLVSTVQGWLKSPTISLWLIPTAGSVAGMFVTALAAGQPITFALVEQAVLIGLAGSGWGKQKADAEAAGDVAAATVVSKATAVADLRKP